MAHAVSRVSRPTPTLSRQPPLKLQLRLCMPKTSRTRPRLCSYRAAWPSHVHVGRPCEKLGAPPQNGALPTRGA